jgi:hypothetical protein
MLRLDHVVLHIAADAVLRTEKGCEFEFGPLGKDIRDVAEIRKHRCLIAYKAYPLSVYKADLLVEQNLDAQSCSFITHTSIQKQSPGWSQGL